MLRRTLIPLLLLAAALSATGVARALHDRLEHAERHTGSAHAHHDAPSDPHDPHDPPRADTHDCPICHWLSGAASIAAAPPSGWTPVDPLRGTATYFDRQTPPLDDAFPHLSRGPPAFTPI